MRFPFSIPITIRVSWGSAQAATGQDLRAPLTGARTSGKTHVGGPPTPSTRSRLCTAHQRLGHDVDMPTTSAPNLRRNRYFARVSRSGPRHRPVTPRWATSPPAARYPSSIAETGHMGPTYRGNRAPPLVVDSTADCPSDCVISMTPCCSLAILRVHPAASVGTITPFAPSAFIQRTGNGTCAKIASLHMRTPSIARRAGLESGPQPKNPAVPIDVLSGKCGFFVIEFRSARRFFG